MIGLAAAVVLASASASASASGIVEGDPPATFAAVFAPPAAEHERETLRKIRDAARAATESSAVVVDYPLDDSIFPPDFASPTFWWHDGSQRADRWLVEWSFAERTFSVIVPAEAKPPPPGEIDPRCVSPTNEPPEPTPYQKSAKTWRPPSALWEAVRRHAGASPVEVTIVGWSGEKPEGPLARGRLRITIAKEPVGAPLFYRDVPLMPSATRDGVIKPLDQAAQPLIQWRLKDVSRDDSRILLRDMPTCANCHSFSADGKTFGMDVDGPDGDKGAYAIAPVAERVVIDDDRVMSWNDFPGKPKQHMTLGFLSRVSPDGRFVVSTVNERLYVRNFADYRIIQVFYPTAGILAWYDVARGTLQALPGADDARFAHVNPTWSPDGKFLVFMRAPAGDPYDPEKPVAMYAGDPNETPIRYDLYRIPWNEGRGGAAEPIPGASGDGMSHSFPKISPDGKWLVWTQARNGMLLRPDGKLWIMPLSGGKPRLMRCNTSLMNSWHAFSPNGRWLVFSSKANTPYTQLFLTHIDENGIDSPAILVENTQAANRAANIPEFVNVPYDAFREIVVPAVEHRAHFYRANTLAKEGKKSEAIGELEKALEGEDQSWRNYDWKYHDKLSRLLLEEGKTDEALDHIRKSLAINPANPAMRANLASILFERGDLAEARRELDLALRLAPNDAKAWLNRAAIRLSQGDAEGALADYTRALEIEPGNAAAFSGRGLASWARKDVAGATSDFSRAIALDPRDFTARFFRARLRRAGGDLKGAAEDLAHAAQSAPAGSPQKRSIEALRAEVEETLAREKAAADNPRP